MLSMKRSMLLCFGLLLCIAPAYSGKVDHSKGWSGMDGNDLLPMCQTGIEISDGNGKNVSASRSIDAIHCSIYIQGFLDGIAVAQVAPGATKILCFPEGVNGLQMVRVVVKWLQDHPARLHEPAYSCVFAAVHDAFACQP